MEELKNRNGSEKLVKYIDFRDDIFREILSKLKKKIVKVVSM